MMRIALWLLKNIFGNVEEEAREAERQAEKAGLTGEEKIKYVQEEVIRKISNRLVERAIKAREELEKQLEKAKKERDRKTARWLEKLLFYYRPSMFRIDKSMAIALILTAEAVKQGLHKDPHALSEYLIINYALTMKDLLEKIPHAHKLTKKDHEKFQKIIDPEYTLGSLLKAITTYRDAEKDEQRKETLEKILDVFIEGRNEIGKRYNEVHANPALIIDIINRKAKEHLGRPVITEEVLGRTLEEEKPLAPQLVAKILEERLPGAAYRLASLLHAYEQGSPLDPKDLERIIEATTAPHSPQGTQQYNLIYKIIDKLEEDTAKGRTPRKPTTIIEEIIREALHLKPYHNTQQILQEIVEGKRPAEAILLKTRLGLPGDKKRIAKTLLNFLRIAREIEEGKRNPYYEDVKSELATIARNLKTVEPRTPTKEYLQKINPQTLEYLHNQIHKEYTERAIQIGRESATRILERAVQIAKQVMEKHRGKPYYQLVAETAREIEETLKTQLGRQPTPEERQEARWAALAIQHLLQTLPIHVAETKEELGMAKALLTQGYNPQEYDAPLVLDTIGKMAQLEKYEEQERKGILELIRMGGQSAEVVKNVAWRTLKAHREEGRMEPREYIRSLMENIGSVSRVKR